jgi:hypothetical protein
VDFSKVIVSHLIFTVLSIISLSLYMFLHRIAYRSITLHEYTYNVMECVWKKMSLLESLFSVSISTTANAIEMN